MRCRRRHGRGALGAHAQAFVAAMRPHRAGRPVVAVLTLNEGTETTDFLLPYAVLQRAGVAEVKAVAPRTGRVERFPRSRWRWRRT